MKSSALANASYKLQTSRAYMQPMAASFIILLWTWKFDKFVPDKFGVIGALIVLFGVAIIYYAPRT